MNRFFRIFIITITIAVSAVFSFNYTKTAPTIYGDGGGYYSYLPAVFIYDNFKTIAECPAPGLESIFDNPDGGLKTPKGYTVIQYTYGVALLEAPFFLLAHAYEKAAGLPANGYSATYKAAIQVSTMFYVLLGIWVLYRILRRYFSSTVTVLTISFLFIGTNLFWFSLFQAGMSHVPLFLLYGLLIYLTILLHEKATTMRFILTGLVAALIVLIRPSDITCLMIPLLYKVYDRSSLLEKFSFLKSNFRKILITIPIAFIPFIPQIVYWKYISGSYFFDSYEGQNFNFSQPKILEGLFSGQNGWLMYSPIMIFSILGFLFYKKIKNWAWCIYLLFPVYIYVIYSWFCYNYINGLGSRPMIHLYPLLAISLAAFISFVAKKNAALKVTFAAVSALLIFVNLSYSVKAAEWKIFSENSNLPYNLQTMFKKNINYTDMVVADIALFQPDTSKIERIKVLACEDYNDSSSANYERDPANQDNFFYRQPAEEEYQDKRLSVLYDKESFKGAKWLKVTGRFMCPEHWGMLFQHVLTMEIKRGDKFMEWRGLQIDNKLALVEDEHLNRHSFHANEWGEVYFFVKIPKDIRDGDEIIVGVWNLVKKPLYTDYYCIELYQ